MVGLSGNCLRLLTGTQPRGFLGETEGFVFEEPALYARGVQRSLTPNRSPTLGLLSGLIITLAAVVAYSWYITLQIAGLRELQSDLADRNRKDSLQLLRVQNDLNLLACHARHARQRRAFPAHGLVGSIPAYPGGPGCCVPAGRASRRGAPH